MFQIKNYMEIIVSEMIDSIMKNLGSCTCENCRFDIAAIALNNLPPRYFATHKGVLQAKLGLLHHQYDIDVIMQLTKAVEVVRKNPRHDDE